MTERIPITPGGAERLRADLRRLKEVERPQVMKAIEAARELGDISDSGDFRAAKERQAYIEGRIRELEAKIGLLQVIDPAKLSGTRAAFGATVTVADAETGEQSTYRLVGEDEADVKAGRISIRSPLARALIGKEAGDEARVATPRGAREVAVVDVRFGG